MILALTLVTASIILGLCLAYKGTSQEKVEPPQSVLTPVPEFRVERRNGVMWSVATTEAGCEIWSIIRRVA
jgi:uncharacterized lipoprotein